MLKKATRAPKQAKEKVEKSEAPRIFKDNTTVLAVAELLKIIILSLIYLLAFSSRLYSVLRYESVIHEFDPYFNYRTTQVLVKEGLYNFINWFDSSSWYPLGRIVGGTVFPGLMLTAGFVHWVLNLLHITINVRNVCVLLAPWFASNTALATYFLTKEVKNSGAGLIAAAMIGVVPAYISRSVAGSYDNEGVAIFALVFTFYLWIKSVNTGSLLWASACSLSYFYMVSAWGGYVFITNLIPLYVFIAMLTGRFSMRMYIAYSVWYVLGTLLAMQVTFVGFQAITSSEHFASFGIFGLLQAYCFLDWVKGLMKEKTFKTFLVLLALLVLVASVLFFGFGDTRLVSPWTGRFYSMFDPTYAKEHIPIIASVSEHQPTTWSSFFFDLHIILLLFPAGLYFCFDDLTDATLFIICYGVSAIYFAGVMVRLMLTLAPVACVLAAIGVSSILQIYFTPGDPKDKKGESKVVPKELTAVMMIGILFMLSSYTYHCTFVTAEAYSSPSIVLAAGKGRNMVIFDDFRESYRWLSQNTAPDARIMSWWDYGYQISAMANRTVLVDNNTWNNTHIAQVGRAMASSEKEAYQIMLNLDADYVLVIFGGVIGYSGDDINKFLWMVRISGGVWPHIKESDYFTSRGEYRVDSEAAPALMNSLMYKLSYYRFGSVSTDPSKPTGYDRVRNVEVGNKKIKLEHLQEVYTSEHWLVRIYKVLPPKNRLWKEKRTKK